MEYYVAMFIAAALAFFAGVIFTKAHILFAPATELEALNSILSHLKRRYKAEFSRPAKSLTEINSFIRGRL